MAQRGSLLVPCLFVALLAVAPAVAQQSGPPKAAPAPKSLGTFSSWTAAELSGPDGKVCYMVARPTKSEGKYAKRGEVLLVVTHRPAAKRRDEVTFQAGYPYKAGTKVPLAVESKKFELVARPDVEPESAWSPDDKSDKSIVAALKSGKTAVVRSVSARSTETTDIFSLAGFSQAYAAIGQACGIK